MDVTAILLFVILILLLVCPLLFRVVEENLEIFFLVMGLVAVSTRYKDYHLNKLFIKNHMFKEK